MSDNDVRLVQLLCPKRHAIFAFAYLPGMSASTDTGDDQILTEQNAVDYLRSIVERWTTNGTINPWCGLCQAPSATWFYEDALTKFETLDQAMPHLKETERKNLEARRILGGTTHRQN